MAITIARPAVLQLNFGCDKRWIFAFEVLKSVSNARIPVFAHPSLAAIVPA
jgi:hypothetical protein